MTVALYDKLGINEDILLDLPFREGVGDITHDVGKPHHPITLVNTPTWATLASDLGIIDFNGINQYLLGLNADTADLGFTNGDYSVGCWFNWEDADEDQIIMGRWEESVGGWEIYLHYSHTGPGSYLTLRHHHAGGDDLRSGVYTRGWDRNVWNFMGLSRSGSTVLHYKNGEATSYPPVGVLQNAEATTMPLIVGVKYTIGWGVPTVMEHYFEGPIWRPRVWGRALSADDWMNIYQIEKGWFA